MQAALTAAGYARDIISYAVNNIFSSDPVERLIYEEGGMSKRMKMATTTTRRSTVPVSKSVKKYVKKCFDRLVDDKYISLAITDATASAAGTVNGNLLFGIVQGTSDSQRVGNHIRVKHVTLKGNWADTVPNNGRIIVFWDRQPNGAAPAFGELITSPSINGMYNHDTVVGCGGQRFTVLFDQRVVIQPEIAATATVKLFGYKNHKQNVVVTYDTTAGAITDMVTNNLCVAYIAAAATMDFVCNIEVCYTDA